MLIKKENLSDSFDVIEYLKEHEKKELLRFITCGSVDDGKSTLIGRLLHDTKMIFEDQLAAVEKDSKKCGTTGDRVDLALLVDGLQSEREQGITIDVAYRYFATDKRKFIIADTPGHEQYTRNMATGASTAELAIILIDARKGVLTQTRRHSYIVSLLGIKNLVVAVNKMDLVGYSEEIFKDICRDYELNVMPNLPGEEKKLFFIPISALEGDNVVENSSNTSFYQGKSLLEILDTIEIGSYRNDLKNEFRLPVQFVNRPNSDFRGYAGTIASGRILVGDEIMVLPSRKTTTVKSIILPNFSDQKLGENQGLNEAFAPMAVTLILADEIDIKRGDMIVKALRPTKVADSFAAMVVWMSEQELAPGENYLIKRATTTFNGYFEQINFKKDINSFSEVSADKLSLNEIGSCNLVIDRKIAADSYFKNRFTGGFIVIDRYTNNTLGAGMIIKPVDRAAKTSIDRFAAEFNAFVRRTFPDWGCKEI